MRLAPAVLLLLAKGLTAQPQLQYAPSPGNYIRVLAGNIFVGSEQIETLLGLYPQPVVHSQIAISTAAQLYRYSGSGNDIPLDARLDPQGNIWIVGNTDSDDFPLVNPIFPQKVPYSTVGFVLELDPTGARILFSTYLGGQSATSPNLSTYTSHATAVTIDAAGNIYVGGDTDDRGFPTTAGVLQPIGPGVRVGIGVGSTYFYAYLAKVSPSGKLIYNTLLGTGPSNCEGGSACIGKDSTFAHISSIAIDANGIATVAGPQGGSVTGVGFISRLNADASSLLWSAQIGGNYGSVDQLFMAQDASSNVYLLGRYSPVTSTPFLPNSIAVVGPPGLFTAKLASTGSQTLYLTDLGQSNSSISAAGIAIDSAGNAYLAGTSSFTNFPTPVGVPNLGADFVLRLDPAGAIPVYLFRFPTGAVAGPPVFDTDGNLVLLGSQGSLVTLPPSYGFSTPAIIGFANSASYAMSSGFSAGALITLFGYDLPQNIQVLIDGQAVPLLFAGPTQINIEVPSFVHSYNQNTIAVVLPSGTISIQPPAVPSLGLFTAANGHAAALNQDGSVNSATNPAPAGSIVSLFGTGDNSTLGESSAFAFGLPDNVYYIGAAPGLSGVFQINLEASPGPITLKQVLNNSQTTISSNAVYIYTK